MATNTKKDPSEYSVEEKLQSLYQLQTMLTEIDKIKTLRGELPLEVQDLEDEIAGLTTRIEKASADVVEMSKGVAENKNTIEVSRQAVNKYQEQQDHVSNNREFDSLNKEIEFKNLRLNWPRSVSVSSQTPSTPRRRRLRTTALWLPRSSRIWRSRSQNFRRSLRRTARRRSVCARSARTWNST